jgi:hypothetical protein
MQDMETIRILMGVVLLVVLGDIGAVLPQLCHVTEKVLSLERRC